MNARTVLMIVAARKGARTYIELIFANPTAAWQAHNLVVLLMRKKAIPVCDSAFGRSARFLLTFDAECDQEHVTRTLIECIAQRLSAEVLRSDIADSFYFLYQGDTPDALRSTNPRE